MATISTPTYASQAKLNPASVKKADSAYLFVYFTGNGPGEEAIHYAISADGYHYKALKKDQPILNSTDISHTGGVRDPHILRGKDGKTFYMVATDMNVAKNGWDANYEMVLMKSKDLIHWQSQVINIPQTFTEFAAVNRVWAPQTIYDAEKGKYMIYWSMRFGNEPDKIYYAYVNKDFTALTTVPKQLFFKPDKGACIDGTIVVKDGKFHLFFKTEGEGSGIKKATSAKLTEGYILEDKYLNQTSDAVEGADVFKLIDSDSWILMYDVYKKGKYQFCRSNDLEKFEVVDQDISMDFHPRHGTVMHISGKEAGLLEKSFNRTDNK